MRRFLIPTLFVSALAMPVAAQSAPGPIVARDSSDRADRRGTEDGPRFRDRPRQANAMTERQIQPPAAIRPRAVAVPRARAADTLQTGWQQTEHERRSGGLSRTPETGRERNRAQERNARWHSGWTGQERQVRQDNARRNAPQHGSDIERSRHGSLSDRNQRHQWNRSDNWDQDWRADRRYDWQGWRSTHRHVYALPRYRAPYGYGHDYRRLMIGIQLDRLLYGRSYWISDPWSYRLPASYGPYRWVRYHDDVLLIDLRDGRVLDVLYDFFW